MSSAQACSAGFSGCCGGTQLESLSVDRLVLRAGGQQQRRRRSPGSSARRRAVGARNRDEQGSGGSWCSCLLVSRAGSIRRRRSRAAPARTSAAPPPARRGARPGRSTRTASATPMPRAMATKSRPREVGAFELRAGVEAEGRRELLQRRVAPVVEDDEGHRQLQLRRRPQRLDRVHRRAVADEARSPAPPGRAERDADRRRQAEAEAAAGHGVEASRSAAIGRWPCIGPGASSAPPRRRRARAGERRRGSARHRRPTSASTAPRAAAPAAPAGAARSRGAGRRSSVCTAVAQVADDGGADRRAGGGLGIVGDLAERRRRRGTCGPWPSTW